MSTEPIPIPYLGLCLDGISEYGFIQCTAGPDGMAVPLAPHPMYNPPIQEDDPAWDCATMGNMICGVEQSAPPFLPETGVNITDAQFGIGLLLCVLGLGLWAWATRGQDRDRR